MYRRVAWTGDSLIPIQCDVDGCGKKVRFGGGIGGENKAEYIRGKRISSAALEQRTYSLVGRFSGPRDGICTASEASSSLSLSLSPSTPLRWRFLPTSFFAIPLSRFPAG
jgi:hypothetical protein